MDAKFADRLSHLQKVSPRVAEVAESLVLIDESCQPSVNRAINWMHMLALVASLPSKDTHPSLREAHKHALREASLQLLVLCETPQFEKNILTPILKAASSDLRDLSF
jgi:hypothetical protein